MDRRPRYYAIKIAVLAVLLAGGWAAFAILGDSWYQLVVAVYLAAVFGQIGFLGHEAGHRQIFCSRRANNVVGLVHGNLLIGLSFGWWTGKHNRHHAYPNQAGKDPDIAIGAIAFTPDQARGRRGAARVLARYQAYLFFPMLLLEAVSMHAISVRAVLNGPVRRRWLEGLLLFTHCAGLSHRGLPGPVLAPGPGLHRHPARAVRPLPGLRVRPQPQGHAGTEQRGQPGLLAPAGAHLAQRQRVPPDRGHARRPQLPDRAPPVPGHAPPGAAPLPTVVRAFCAQAGLHYCEKGLVSSYSEVLPHLHAAGRR